MLELVVSNRGSHDDTSHVSLWLGRSRHWRAFDRPPYLIRSLPNLPAQSTQGVTIICLVFVCYGFGGASFGAGDSRPPGPQKSLPIRAHYPRAYFVRN